ncbi:conserved hypothetical protein [Aeropyrum pernix]|uniref:SpoVT-AbrB domain-containing protein n=1 Tax=Aeropyrum pernix TaxID=56636 RepID=A0A401H7Q9_AERPX|nr:conserved hypothetical protein [Aeropyrum pernix]
MAVVDVLDGRAAYKRRIQLTGRSTYIVSLPKEWVETWRLGRGSEVTLEVMPDGSLKIAPAASERPARRDRRVIDLRGKELDLSFVIKSVIASYLAGYDEVLLLFGDGSVDAVSKIRSIVESNILGFNVLEEGPGYIVFVSVVDHRSMEFSRALSRMARIAAEMLRDVARGLENGDRGLLDLVAERDQLVDKLYLYMARQMTMASSGRLPLKDLGVYSPAEIVHLFLAVKSIERVADHATILSVRVSASLGAGMSVETGLSSLVMEAAEGFSKSVEALIKADAGLAASIAPVLSEYRSRLESMTAQEFLRGGGSLLRYLVIDSMRRITGYSLDIAEAALDISAVREKAKSEGP